MNKYFLFLILLSFVLLFSCQKGRLSKKEKTEDFLYLYETLKANYPYFDMVKQKHGVDWLAKKEEYIDKIRSTKNDTAYIRTLGAILGALHDGHTDMGPTANYTSYLSIYRTIAKENQEYNSWVKALEENQERTKYWSDFLIKERSKEIQEEETSEIRSDYNSKIIADKGIAVMNIPSFSHNYMAQDSSEINQFLTNLHGIDKLIINIQGNSGGSTEYWQKLIVPRLIRETIHYSLYMVIKKGALNRTFLPEYFKADYEISKEDSFYSKIPECFLDDSYLVVKTDREIVPANPVNFKGTIYLLVDNNVFSASEAFTYFSKITNWAIVAGIQTGGDGIGRDPMIISLPHSGIKIRYVGIGGFNADRGLNAEKGTTPDWFIFGKSERERLNELIYKITSE